MNISLGSLLWQKKIKIKNISARPNQIFGNNFSTTRPTIIAIVANDSEASLLSMEKVLGLAGVGPPLTGARGENRT